MAGDKQDSTWPVPSMHFKVTLGDKGEVAFQKVNGLQTKFETIEYRAGNSPSFENVKMPLFKSSSDVVLSKGVFVQDTILFNWLSEIKLNTIARQTVTIQLLDEEHKPMFTWTLANAFPKSITFGELDAMKATFAVEELVISHEGLQYEAN